MMNIIAMVEAAGRDYGCEIFNMWFMSGGEQRVMGKR